ncbi:MAG: hypothetical protein M1834_000211 [Cirrosporium novae-zelandiae]|nr:MAG: hypothetical protein M1834_000211 [Cirrosporium novae-zelandiae]
MAADRATSSFSTTFTTAHVNGAISPSSASGPSQMRYRAPRRSSTIADLSRPSIPRRGSILSDGFSETRQSMRSSTDNLFLPRVDSPGLAMQEESSPWHSIPLALALLPALAGVFFKNGNAVVTDITLLLLATILLNWSVRLPWNWYFSAQSVRVDLPEELIPDNIITEESDGGNDNDDENEEKTNGNATKDSSPLPKAQFTPTRNTTTMELELHIYELIALLTCFLGPLLGAYVLHTIRSQLSRPSEGLISNYNLTIFLLASEIRPLMHLIKMVQARTLYLQRIIHANPFDEADSKAKMADLGRRVEELEMHAAKMAELASISASPTNPSPTSYNIQTNPKLLTSIIASVRTALQPDIDTVNRAMRRLDKRGTLQAIQTESRLREIETKMQDAITLAAAAERTHQNNGFAMIVLNWICAAIVLPVRGVQWVLGLPKRFLAPVLWYIQRSIGLRIRKEVRTATVNGAEKQKERERDRIKSDREKMRGSERRERVGKKAF